jgi:YggT family protein
MLTAWGRVKRAIGPADRCRVIAAPRRRGRHRLRSESAACRFRRRFWGRFVLTIVFNVVEELLSLYRWAVILAAVFSILVSFGVLDTRNRLVWTVGDFLYRITEPALRPLRRIVPSIGNIDITPIILLVIIWAAQEVLQRIYFAIVTGSTQGLLF